MSTAIPDAPFFLPIVKALAGGKPADVKMDKNWEDWFLAQNRALADLQKSVPISAAGYALISGPGPVTTTANITMRRAGVLTIIGNIIQTWATSAPSWSLALQVDGSNVVTTGTITNTWQNVVTLQYQASLTAGAHSFAVVWTTGSANATLSAISVVGTPLYTS